MKGGERVNADGLVVAVVVMVMVKATLIESDDYGGRISNIACESNCPTTLTTFTAKQKRRARPAYLNRSSTLSGSKTRAASVDDAPLKLKKFKVTFLLSWAKS